MRFPTIVVRSEVLTSWLTVSDYSQSRLAAELGVSRGRISQLLSSLEEPSAHLIANLMTLTHLPFERLFKIIPVLPSSLSSVPQSSASPADNKNNKKDKKKTILAPSTSKST